MFFLLFAFSNVVTTEAIWAECIEQMSGAFRALRTGCLGWKALHQYVMQLEILNNRLDLAFCHLLLPVAVVVLSSVAVVAIVGVLLVTSKLMPCIPNLLAYLFLFMITSFIIVVGFAGLRAGEILAKESESAAEFCQLNDGRNSLRRVERDELLRMKYRRRVFNRRPVTIKTGLVMDVEAGMAFGYLQKIFDNVLVELSHVG